MTEVTNQSARTASLIRTLCGAEGDEVVFRFDEPLSVPTEKYDGSSYRSETLPKATLHATIHHAILDHLDGVFSCYAEVYPDELDRVGIDPSVVDTESGNDGSLKCAVVEVQAGRDGWVDESDYCDVSVEEAERAVEEGREEEVLPPWDGLPTVMVDVERTIECHKRAYNSDFHVQYSPPSHEIGTLIDVRLK